MSATNGSVQANGDLLNAKLPSWVPDYNTKDKGSLLNHRSFDITRFLYKEGAPYNQVQVFVASGLLRVKGIIFCQIDEICRIIQKLLWPYPSHRIEVLWRALIVDYYNLRDPATYKAQDSFRQFIAYSMAIKFVYSERKLNMGYDKVWRYYTWYDKLLKNKGILLAQNTIDTVK
ncbi:hypothetical protein L207DRAFT_539445 [Hyaloscypha variabilis F]|uniref:Uncharacterized protein n=1 Tax=Hyaloscypha variabilis (strain UAMH 11265 / GT02V1 / F) TaxID=1149755 RepID=A0A2J6QR58_HYAVF|nr:hypothetical protein L207DRAFT_539445 [Hyaloscypha variabilis F]